MPLSSGGEGGGRKAPERQRISKSPSKERTEPEGWRRETEVTRPRPLRREKPRRRRRAREEMEEGRSEPGERRRMEERRAVGGSRVRTTGGFGLFLLPAGRPRGRRRGRLLVLLSALLSSSSSAELLLLLQLLLLLEEVGGGGRIFFVFSFVPSPGQSYYPVYALAALHSLSILRYPEAYTEAIAKAKAEEEALIASEKAREAAEAAKKLEKEAKKLSDKEADAATLANEAKAKAEAAGFSLDNLLTKAKDLSSSAGGFSFEKLSSQISTAVSQRADNGDDEPKTQIATVRGRAKARSLLPQKAVVKKAALNAKPKKPEPKSKPNKEDEKVEVRNLFGGLFKQETIYIDDD